MKELSLKYKLTTMLLILTIFTGYGVCKINSLQAANEDKISMDFIMAAGDYNLSKIIDGRGDIEMTQETTLLDGNESKHKRQEFRMNVSFIGSNMEKMRIDSLNIMETDSKEKLVKHFFNEQTVINYTVNRKVASIESIEETVIKWSPTPMRWICPLQYGVSIDGKSFRNALNDLKNRGASYELKKAPSEDFVLLEGIRTDEIGNIGKVVYQMDITKNFFINKSEGSLRMKGQDKWIPVKSVEIVPVLTNVGWLPQEVTFTLNSYEGINGEVVLRLTMREKTIYKNFKFNLGLQEADLKINLPKGTFVVDQIAGIQYFVGADGVDDKGE